MDLDFDIASVVSIDFGVGIDDADGEGAFFLLPVSQAVKDALEEIVVDTWNTLNNVDEEPELYEPAERYSSKAFLVAPLSGSFVDVPRDLHNATNLPLDRSALDEPAGVFCYFAKFTDASDRKITALKRATQFKGLIKSRNRLVSWVNDSLALVADETFKLDHDFDMIVDSSNVFILHPSGFEFIGKLQKAICEAVPENIALIGSELDFVDFSTIESYALKHPRAARNLASIRSQKEAQNVKKSLLKKACKIHGVELKVRGGKFIIPSGSEMVFLDILDRRMYEQLLVEDSPETYRAGSRRRI